MIADSNLTEEQKMRTVPGIVFVDGPSGRRAHVIGGLDVFEIIKEYRLVDCDRDRLARVFAWLTLPQTDAALTFHAAFPDEIDERLAEEDALTPEAVYARYPFMRPR